MTDRPPPRPASVARDIGVSLLVTLVCIVLVALAGEVYFRMTRPFLDTAWPLRFVPGVGYVVEPGAEVRDTNNLDYWVAQRANSQGFLADEPSTANPEACRVALIGDSFIQAVQVPIAEKMARRLTELGADARPPFPLAVAAYGYGGTGQLNQLPFYDHYARAFAPRVVVLVVVANDFANNSAALEAIRSGMDPDHPHRAFARRAADGSIEMAPVDAEGWRSHMLRTPSHEADPIPYANMYLVTHSYFYAWIYAKLGMVAPRLAVWLSGTDRPAAMLERAEQIARRPAYANVLEGWDPRKNTAANPTLMSMDAPFSWPDLPPVFQEAMAFTGYALDAFKARAERDGAALVIFSTDTMRADDPGQLMFKRLQDLAAARGIPVVDMSDYMQAHGLPDREAILPYDGHWSPKGHQWAAQALFAYLSAHPELCRPPRGHPADLAADTPADAPKAVPAATPAPAATAAPRP